MLFHTQRLWIDDPDEQVLVAAPIGGQRDISAAAFAPDGTLLVADRGQRIRTYDPATWTVRETLAPRLDAWEMLYYFLVEPLYDFFPIPSRLEEVMIYLLQDRSTMQVGENDLSVAQVQVEVVRPMITNFVFMALVLSLTCLYISRRDF